MRWGAAGLFSTSLGFDARGAVNEKFSGHPDIKINGHWGNKRMISTGGMVCASQPLAVATGYDVLKAGGNAIDAAVAVNAMLCLTEPMMSGLGGDLFAIVWNEKEKKLQRKENTKENGNPSLRLGRNYPWSAQLAR